jgi:hypothetical protein
VLQPECHRPQRVDPHPYCTALVEVEAKDALKVIFVQNDDQVFGCVNLKGQLVAPPSGTPDT